MAKAFSVASWNVEHFRGKRRRVDAVLDHLTVQGADVVALYEVEGKEVFGTLSQAMPNYNFHITEGRQTQEILVGVRRNIQAFFSQRVTFKAGNQSLRPGALVTLTIDGANYSLLFLHLKSMAAPVGLGLRDHQLASAYKLKRKLDKAAGDGKRASFIFLGDLNTMGMKYPFGRSITASKELEKIDRDTKRKSVLMRRLAKTYDATWWNGPKGSYPPSNLDHVVASQHLQFKQMPAPGSGGFSLPVATAPSDVAVRGWPGMTARSAQTWIDLNSDHALLYFEVQKV